MGVKRLPKRLLQQPIRQIEGRNPVREALRAGTPLTKIILEEGMRSDERIEEIYRLAQQNNIPIEKYWSKKLTKLSKTGGHHQGVIAYAQPIEEKSIKDIVEQKREEGKNLFVVILSDVLYEHNLGAVLRTAESTGVDAVVVPKKAPELTAVVNRTAVGAGEYVPLIHENLFQVVDYLKDEGVKLFGTKEGKNKSLYRTNFTGPVAIIMGAEDTGISESLQKQIDEFISIPMLGHIESLNMSVAAAICMYEVVRQRKYSK
jgi:23S rRNA (guanosine2251-2'-O)-methyltransferase